MKRTLLSLALAACLAVSPAFGATENSVDRNLSVREDFAFRPDTAFVSLHIQERHINEFGGNPVNFRLRLINGTWFETGDPADPSAMEADTDTFDGAAVISIRRLGDQDLEVTLNRNGAPADQKAWWRIPIYGQVEDVGPVTIEIDGRDGLVSSGTYEIARVPGGNYLTAGYQFTPENQQWFTFKEPEPNAYAGRQTFRLVLENGSWFSDQDNRLSPGAMQKNAVIGGIEAGSFAGLRRVDSKTLEVTLDRGAASSVKAQGVWSLPLYFKVDQYGLTKINVEPLESAVRSGSLSDGRETAPVRYIRTVTLRLNQPEITGRQGAESRTVKLDQPPVNPAGTTLVPVRGVFEQLGGTVVWDSQRRTATIAVGDQRIEIHADSDSALLSGRSIRLPQQPVILNSRLMIPLRAVSEQLGFGVEWNEAAQQITIRQD